MIASFLKNLFTTNNGEDLSFAKIMGAIGFLMIVMMITVGVPVWTLLALQSGITRLPSLSDWASYYTGAAVLIAAAYAGLGGLLWGTNKTENPLKEKDS